MTEVIIPMNTYGEFFIELARSIKASDVDDVYAKHKAYCANCGVQFSREALSHLNLFGPKSELGGRLTVLGASRQGTDIRAGRCPNCGHSEMRIVKLDAPEKLYVHSV